MEVKARSKGDGLYSCSYTPASPLKHTLSVAWGGVGVPNSPFRVSSQSRHPVQTGTAFPPEPEGAVEAGRAQVVQSGALVQGQLVKAGQSAESFGAAEPKRGGREGKVKKRPLIIITYTEERYSC